MTRKDNQKNDNKVPEKHSKNYEDKKSKIDKEIEAELLEYLNRDKTNEKEEKQEKKKYKSAMFVVLLIIVLLYLFKMGKHFMYIDINAPLLYFS